MTDDAEGTAPARRIVFVCTGNICRSPMAEVVLRRLAGRHRLADGSRLADSLVVSSAGTGGWHIDEPMDPRAAAALAARGYRDHGHRARAFDPAWLPDLGLVVCLARRHRQTLLGLARARVGDDRHAERLVLLRSFDRTAGGAVDVPDPFYGDAAAFEHCLDLVETGCRGLVRHLADAVGPAG